jgi:hypothetical protein
MDIIEPGKICVEQRDGAPLPTSETKFTLAEQAADWHYFSHGALFTHGGLTFPHEDPVADWFVQQPSGVVVIRQPFKKRVFNGLTSLAGPLTWNHMIMAVRHEYWQSLWEFLGGVVTFDDTKSRYCQVFSGDIDIIDPVFLERHSFLHSEPPMVKVTVFCVDATDGRWEVRPPFTPGAMPCFVRLPARPEVTEIGRAVAAGNIEALQHKDNVALQPLLDKYTALRERGTDENFGHNTARS